MACELRIGTSGWHYSHWVGPFYPTGTSQKNMLEFYSTRFDTVELNNTFYKLPTEKALLAWRDESPEGFVFATKGSRFLTHMKKLKDPESGTERFFSRVAHLEPKLGPVLFQLPPNWAVNAERLRHFLEVLPSGRRYAFEFRDASWHSDEVYDALRRRGAAFCVFDIAGHQAPVEITADFTYLRFHGPSSDAYAGSYDTGFLREWAGQIRGWQRSLRAIYVYFDNDQAGYAAQNALALREML